MTKKISPEYRDQAIRVTPSLAIDSEAEFLKEYLSGRSRLKNFAEDDEEIVAALYITIKFFMKQFCITEFEELRLLPED